MVSQDDFVLHVTAGSKYDEHKNVLVNTDKPIKISTVEADVEIIVRIKNFRGVLLQEQFLILARSFIFDYTTSYTLLLLYG
jgi:hypothetical protein